MTEDLLWVANLPGGVQRLTLHRPERLNALSSGLVRALVDHFEGLRRNAEVRIVLLSGEGRAFCAGADLKATDRREEFERLTAGDWLLNDLVRAMRACPQPIISLVRGAAAGGGFAIALASDVIVASMTARFIPGFYAVGLSGSELGVGWLLQRAIGIYRAREVLLANRPLNADAALAMGLISTIVDDAELERYGESLAADMSKAPAGALRITKRTLDATLGAASLEIALELDERAQMTMLLRRGPVTAG